MKRPQKAVGKKIKNFRCERSGELLNFLSLSPVALEFHWNRPMGEELPISPANQETVNVEVATFDVFSFFLLFSAQFVFVFVAAHVAPVIAEVQVEDVDPRRKPVHHFATG